MRTLLHRRRGFSLVELLVVISIIAVLSSLLLPAIGQVQGSARAARCVSNQRQIMLAVVAYTTDNENALPPAGVNNPGGWLDHYFKTDLLGQFLEITAVGNEKMAAIPGGKLLICPEDRQSGGWCSYGLNTDFHRVNSTLRDSSQLRRTGLVALVTDVAGEGRWETNSPVTRKYTNLQASPDYSGGASDCRNWVPRHRGGANVGFADGSVRRSPEIGVEQQAGTLIVRWSRMVAP